MMIIKFPTALYQSVLPRGAESGNVTFTISSQDPPRSLVSVQQLPIAERTRPLPDRIFTREQNRDVLAELVFIVSSPSQSEVGSNRKQFEVGETLEFIEDQALSPEVRRAEVPGVIDLLQNTNLFDLKDFGLSDDEVNDIISAANSSGDALLEEINVLRRRIEDDRVALVENQKELNEINGTIDALKVISPNGSTIIDKLLETRKILLEERDRLTKEISDLNQESEQKFSDLIKVRKLIR